MIFIISCLQGTFLAPQVSSKPFKRASNLNKFNNPSPSHHGVHNEIIPNKVFQIGLMPMFLVEHPIISFKPNIPKCNALEKVPNRFLLANFLGILSLRRGLVSNGSYCNCQYGLHPTPPNTLEVTQWQPITPNQPPHSNTYPSSMPPTLTCCPSSNPPTHG